MTVSQADDSSVSTAADEPNRNSGSEVRRWIVFAAVALVGILIVVGLFFWVKPPVFHGTLIQSPEPATDFTMVASNGERVRLSDLRGKFVMLTFGYTFCPDVCPMTLAEMSDMADALGESKMENVQVLFVSVDPERDTPEHLNKYVTYFNPNFLGLTGTLEEMDPVATQFGVFYEHHKEEGQTAGYLVDHSTQQILIDPDGYIRIVYAFGTPGEGIAKDMRYFLRREIF